MASRRILVAAFLAVVGVHGHVDEIPNMKDIMSIVAHKPFETLNLIHAPVTADDVDFYLNTRGQSYSDYRLDDRNLHTLDTSKPFKYIAHGWMENGRKTRYKDMTEELLKHGDYNVIRVDWYKPAMYTYPASADNTRGVGALIGDQIVKLHQQFNLPLENVHVIGHSLGSHVAGFAGKRVKEMLGRKIERITGLDPAGPLFEPLPISNRLNSGDAQMVDIIHTDGGVFGFFKPIGTVDFFANGGVPFQPGCAAAIPNILDSRKRGDYFFCSHARSVSYFIESINSNGFVATECKDFNFYKLGYCKSHRKALAGMNLPQRIRGDYYFTTNSRSPFGLH